MVVVGYHARCPRLGCSVWFLLVGSQKLALGIPYVTFLSHLHDMRDVREVAPRRVGVGCWNLTWSCRCRR